MSLRRGSNAQKAVVSEDSRQRSLVLHTCASFITPMTCTNYFSVNFHSAFSCVAFSSKFSQLHFVLFVIVRFMSFYSGRQCLQKKQNLREELM